ncbi:DNA-binding transcriptional regulator LsrR (DeoR family) [Nocardia pseudobrasiliensis]|uniref:DNA-binding transcriptional regulator LsrR (DeoR family) n=1 Tax=Nocardia pseudobrasiliensis TaxID=45979 RepID=A0A370HWE7_9NOCA|nr:DNA-binding transcriptional regulator LsrR (DeoR family) [Nocardia pseudobrasiliensis]
MHGEVERELEAAYGLTEAVVLGTLAEGSPTGLQSLAHAAVGVLSRRLRPTDTLGFTWGPETIAVARELRSNSARCATVVQLDGALTSSDYQTGVDFTLGRCASQLQATPVRLHAPLYADAATVTALHRDSILGRALATGRAADVMMFGVGTVSTATTLFDGSYLDTAILDELRGLGAIGEVGGRFFRADGSEIAGALAARTVSIDLDAVRSCRTTMLIGGGAVRHEAVLGALRGGLATILITDIDCARWLLEQKEGRP